jgi:alanine racemase
MINPYYTLDRICQLISFKYSVIKFPSIITKLIIDSRSIVNPEDSLYFALSGQRDGHDFIKDAFEKGVRNFIVSKAVYTEEFPDANFIVVENTLIALQQLAQSHRSRFSIPVLAITGSNGKTIVKEWLYQLLALDYNVVRSPKSFNSKIGVPLSLWQINEEHTLAIIEAGISTTREMEDLALLIHPTIGILTNVGTAHSEGFISNSQKLDEKLKLFKNCDLLIYSPDYTDNLPEASLPGKSKFSWSLIKDADLKITAVEPKEFISNIKAVYQGNEIDCIIPFGDRASIENGIICWATLLALGYSPQTAKSRLGKLTSVSMRLELKHGINQCSIIDDSYSADISSLSIALDFLNQQNQHVKKTVILSDLFQTGKDKAILYKEIATLLYQKNINRLIGIGIDIKQFSYLFDIDSAFFEDTDAFLDQFSSEHFNNETILIKGARKFQFERISKLLTQKIHDTVMEINLNALIENLQFYKSKLQKGVKVMAMVKAFSYGSGSYEIANLLQYLKVDYLAVAYADEGIALRKSGINLPIMVMSPEPSAFEAILKYQLEPELYSLSIFKSFANFLGNHHPLYPVHLKIDTGMKRLGFEESDLPELLNLLSATNLKIVSVFSHLAASEDPQHDDFTQAQINSYRLIVDQIQQKTNYSFLQHISNTSAITRFPQAQMDMVRLGIGLYGFDAALDHNKGLKTVAVLKTTITQVKQIDSSQTVGYGRRGALLDGGTIATVKIGYADGYRRSFGNGIGKMLINGKVVSTVGSIAMDMCMVNVTGVDAKEGDEVILFNDVLTIEDLAKQIGTIPYEILTNISQRVKRVYFYE